MLGVGIGAFLGRCNHSQGLFKPLEMFGGIGSSRLSGGYKYVFPAYGSSFVALRNPGAVPVVAGQ